MAICLAVDRVSTGAPSDLSYSCWKDTQDAYRIASAAGNYEATYRIGQIIERGQGTTASEFVAADWYVKAGEQSMKAANREGALIATEAALRAVPDHPAGLRLKKALMH